MDQTGSKRKIPLNSEADVIGVFGDYIYVCRNKSEFSSELEFLNSNLESVRPFPSLPKEVMTFTVRSEQVAACIEFNPTKNTNELILLSKN
jgi:hypothetical protein